MGRLPAAGAADRAGAEVATICAGRFTGAHRHGRPDEIAEPAISGAGRIAGSGRDRCGGIEGDPDPRPQRGGPREEIARKRLLERPGPAPAIEAHVELAVGAAGPDCLHRFWQRFDHVEHGGDGERRRVVAVVHVEVGAPRSVMLPDMMDPHPAFFQGRGERRQILGGEEVEVGVQIADLVNGPAAFAGVGGFRGQIEPEVAMAEIGQPAVSIGLAVDQIRPDHPDRQQQRGDGVGPISMEAFLAAGPADRPVAAIFAAGFDGREEADGKRLVA